MATYLPLSEKIRQLQTCIIFVFCPILSISDSYFVRVYNKPKNTKLVRTWYEHGMTEVASWHNTA